MEGIILIPSGPISEEAKLRLKKRMEKRDEGLREMVEDTRNGRFDHLIKNL